MENNITKRRQKVADIIREARELQGLTQEELGIDTGFSRNTISRIENYKFSPNADQLYIIFERLNIQMKINDQLI